MDNIKFLVKIDNKGRITIPQHVRESLGIGLGTYFEVVADFEKKQIVLKPLFKGKAEGVTVEVKVKLKEINELQDIIKTCIDGGYDVISLSCIYGEAYECVLDVYAIDDVQAGKLLKLLRRWSNY